MGTNVKTVKIVIPNEAILNRINSTPTLKKLSRLDLVVGENTERVNYFQFSQMSRLSPSIGVTIFEIKENK